MTAQEVLSEAVKLKPSDRLSVARELLDSVDETDDIDEPVPDLSPELIASLERIEKDMEYHHEKLVPWDEVERELDEELNNASLP